MSRDIRLTVMFGIRTEKEKYCPKDKYGYPIPNYCQECEVTTFDIIESDGYEYCGIILMDQDAKYEATNTVGLSVNPIAIERLTNDFKEQAKLRKIEYNDEDLKYYTILRDDS